MNDFRLTNHEGAPPLKPAQHKQPNDLSSAAPKASAGMKGSASLQRKRLVMKVFSGQARTDLEELVAQLRAHGAGGGSPTLGAAMAKFKANGTHDLSLTLATMLLSLEWPAIAGGGGGGVVRLSARFGDVMEKANGDV